VEVPRALGHWRDAPGGAAWLDSLPRLAGDLAGQWGLTLEEPFDTPHSLVVPAGDAVLKLNAPSHFEADHEADALAAWDGRGAVRLLARDDARRALLVERCRPGTRLWDAAAPDQEAEVAAALLPDLAVRAAPGHPFRLAADEAARWTDEIPRRWDAGGRPFERRLLDFAVDVLRATPAGGDHLANQDLHGGNILRAEREPWLVIDPKPLVGEPELDGVGVLRNAAVRGRSPVASARRALDALAAAGLDRGRLHGWGVAHALAWGWDDEGAWSPRSVAAAEAVFAAA
jgi:streptomycin 6-kinase